MFGGLTKSDVMELCRRKTISTLLICIVTLMLTELGGRSVASSCLSNKQGRSSRAVWKRISPESWFSINLPEKQYEITPAADANAKTYSSDSLEVHYIYWLAENTPHFIRWAREQENTPTADTSETILLRKKIRFGKWNALLTKTKKRKTQEKLSYSLSIWLPKVRVVESGEKGQGEFELTVRYQKPVDEKTAWRIIESLKIN